MVAFLPFILTDWLPHSHFKVVVPVYAFLSYHVRTDRRHRVHPSESDHAVQGTM